MKLSNLIHKTPWWGLIGGGLVLLAMLAVFVTPVNLLRLQKSGANAQEKQAIKREIDYAFSESAIDVARSVVREMRAHTKDPETRAELDRALEEIDQARTELREAGREVLRAKRDAANQVSQAVGEATRSIEQAQREAARALKEAGVDDQKVNKALEDSMRAAREAEKDARAEAEKRAQERVDEAQKRLDEARARAAEKEHKILSGHGKIQKKDGAPEIRIEIGDDHVAEMPKLPDGTTVNAPPLPAELRDDIHRKVSHDLRRIGLGAGLILLFIPLFILTIVSKFFIDRSRASLRVADDKRKEAEYHRMSQQVTEARLQALQAQVEPHFLYNTLASVQALTEVDPQRANTLTGHLIMYLRNALPKMRQSESTVQQEIELVSAYLNILKMRMGDRLAFEIDVPPELANVPFPPLMLPTLVENAIKHGLEPLREGGKVTIKAETREGILRFSVADNGKGFAENLGAGVGLANIRERLAAIYGEKGKLLLEANEPRGVVSTIEVPRDGVRLPGAQGASMGDPLQPPPAPEPPKGATAKTLAALGKAERVWRKGLSFAFFAMVIVAAVVCGLALVGMLTGLLPIHLGDGVIEGPTGALIGTAGILLAFILIVIALAIVVAVFYGLGFLVAGLLVFIPLMIVVSLVPALAPFILIGLFIWWLVRRSKRKAAAAAAAGEPRVEPTIKSPDADSHPR